VPYGSIEQDEIRYACFLSSPDSEARRAFYEAREPVVVSDCEYDLNGYNEPLNITIVM